MKTYKLIHGMGDDLTLCVTTLTFSRRASKRSVVAAWRRSTRPCPLWVQLRRRDHPRACARGDLENIGGQAARPISTGKLQALLLVHTLPINHVVYVGSSGALRLGIPNLEGGFPLRCFQRLSRPNIATRRCHWRDNRNTIGSSNSVLSY